MLKSYEAIYENGRVKWLSEQPSVSSARVIVTVLDTSPTQAIKRRCPPEALVGQVKIVGDIVEPFFDEVE